jgi:hypothetical protein
VRAAPERAARLQKQFAGLPAIREVLANPVTGNVLFTYDPSRIRERDIMKMLRRLGWVPTTPATGHPCLPQVAPRAHSDTTGHRILEKLIAALLELLFLRLLRLA